MSQDSPFVYAPPYVLPEPIPGHMDKHLATHHDMRTKLYYVVPEEDEKKLAEDLIACYIRRRYRGLCEHLDPARPNRLFIDLDTKKGGLFF